MQLKGKVAVVAGATRGAGRGIAVMLGQAGATVYVTGRSVRGNLSEIGRSETIDETAEMVTAQGGIGIPIRVDHTVEEDVQALFSRIQDEQNGQLDLLVNDVWGGDPLTEWGKPFWELNAQKGKKILEQSVFSHFITSRYGAPLMAERNNGLIIEITDGDTYDYRGSFYYSLAKVSAIHLAQAMAEDFKNRNVNVTSVALTPGFLRSEAMLDHFGVTKENWQEAVKIDPHFIASETPYFVGKAVVALANDQHIIDKTGKALTSWDLSDEYGFDDVDGRKPHWGKYFKEHINRD